MSKTHGVLCVSFSRTDARLCYYYYYYYYYYRELLTPAEVEAFPWILKDSKSPQISCIIHGILADLNTAVVRMISIRPLISKSSSSCTNHFWLHRVHRLGITIAFMFHSFHSSLARSRYLSLFLLSFSFTLWSAGTAKFTIRQVLFFIHYL